MLREMEENNEIDEHDNTFEPGSARYGNFINYYSFNPAENRMRLLPNFMQYVDKSTVLCLDIGCNTGELTQELHGYITNNIKKDGPPRCHILAVDIDEILIERANEKNQNQLLSFKCVDVLSEDFKQVYSDFLKQHNALSFDIVFCFSITMWIHLNHGDEGLKYFITSLSEITDMLVLEPQPWKCYTRAMRRLRRNNGEPFQQFDNLTIRKEVECYINNFLTEKCNFSRVLLTAPTRWGRQINFYMKKKD